MAFIKSLYKSPLWVKYSAKVKNRDGNCCTSCGDSGDVTVLQVHHLQYIDGYKPWEYPISDCITLCQKCHSVEHRITEPISGWVLISIEDLQTVAGFCERESCGQAIRYKHLIYRPDWGYLSVGSTCVEYLTREDQQISSETIKLYKNISSFVHKTKWDAGFTKKDKPFISANYGHHVIRIYGKQDNWAFQTVVKIVGSKKRDYSKIFQLKDKPLDIVKEMGYIALKGLISQDESEKIVLRNLYKVNL